jgi:pyruvate-formate lyase-activating enzyme
MAITYSGGTITLTNETDATFDDIYSAGVAGITKDQNVFVITAELSLVNSTLSDTNKIIKFEWGAISTPLLIDDDSELQLGELDGDGYGINGCQVFMNNSFSTSIINLGSTTGNNTGNIKFYGCYIKGTSPNTTGIGINGVYFWRFYDDDTSQVCDIRDCQFEFNGGGRFHGTNSKLVRNKFINCKTSVSPFTTRNPFGEINDNQVFACSASYYWYPLQSGSLTVSNAFGRDNDYAAIVSSVSSDTNQTLTFVDADFDVFTFSWLGPGGANLRVREDYNYVPTILDQETQNPITSGRVYIENLAGTQVHNEALDGNGQVGELILRAGQYRKATGNTRTDETPHTVKVRCYGYQYQEFPIDIDARTVTNLSEIINNFVVANESTAGAYTGIVVNGAVQTITVTADHSIQQVFDYCNWWAAQSANMQYDMPISTADGINFTLAAGWLITVTGSGVELIQESARLTDKSSVFTVASGAFFEDADGAIWEASGSLYYASHAYLSVFDSVTAAELEGAIIGWGDATTEDVLLYNTSLVLDTLVTDVNGEAEGYFVYRIDSTTYADTKQITGEYDHIYSTIPRSLDGAPIGTSGSPAVIRLAPDPQVTLSKAAAGAITGITVDATNDVIDLSDETLPNAYDNLKYQVTADADIDTGIPACMYFCLYGLPLNKSAGTSYTGRTSTTIYQNFADGGVLSSAIVEFDTPASYNYTFGEIQFNFDANGTYNFGGSTFQAGVTVDTINDSTVTFQVGAGVVVTNNDPTNITVEQTPTQYGITFENLVAGSSVRVFQTGTQTLEDNNESTGTSWTWSEETTGSITVDYTIQQPGYRPIRVTGVQLTAAETGGVITVQVQQVLDRSYVASSGLTFGTTAIVDANNKEVEVSAATTVQNWYSFMIESWIDETALYNVAFPFDTNGPNSFTLTDGWEWGDGATSIAFLSRDGMRYTDGGTTTAVWAAFLSIGVPAGLTVRYQQSDGGTTQEAGAAGEIDELIQIFGDTTHGNFDVTGYLVLKAQGEGYDEGVVDAVALYGTLEDQFYVVGLLPSANGVATGDPSVSGVTITDHGASPVTWNGKEFSITITDSAGGNTGTDIMRWLRYNYGQGGTFQGKDAFNWHDLVQTSGSDFQTVRGVIYGDVGATLKGVRVVQNDGTTSHPDFASFTADDGTAYVPPTQVTISNSNIVNGCRVQLYNVTQDIEIENRVLTSAGYSYTGLFGPGENLEDGDVIRLRATYQSGVTAKLPYEQSSVVSAAGISFLGVETDDEVYILYGVDGSGVTKFAADYVQDDINLVIGGNWTGEELYAWWVYNLTTEQGIREFFGAVTAIDAGNIRFNTDVVGLLLDNNTANNYYQNDNIRIFRSDEAYPVRNPTTGGGGLDVVWRSQVYVATVTVSGSNVITGALADVEAAIDAQTADLKGADDRDLTEVYDNGGTGSGVTEAQVQAIADAQTVDLKGAGNKDLTEVFENTPDVNLQPVLDAIAALNDITVSDIEASTVLSKEATLTNIANAVAQIPTTDSVADLTPVLTAIAALNDVTPAQVRAAFDEAEFKDKNTEAEIHNWLDSYANKNDWKASNINLQPVLDAISDVDAIVKVIEKLTGFKSTYDSNSEILTIYEADGVTVWREYTWTDTERTQI